MKSFSTSWRKKIFYLWIFHADMICYMLTEQIFSTILHGAKCTWIIFWTKFDIFFGIFVIFQRRPIFEFSIALITRIFLKFVLGNITLSMRFGSCWKKAKNIYIYYYTIVFPWFFLNIFVKKNYLFDDFFQCE